MNIEWQDAFNGLVLLAVAMGGWIAGRITRSLDQLDRDVRQMPEKYVAKADYRQDMVDIKALLQRIDEKLDGKADK
jgi:hypothetical protein